MEYLRFKKSFLRRMRPEMASERRRLAAVRADQGGQGFGRGDASAAGAGRDAADRPPLQFAASYRRQGAEPVCGEERARCVRFAMWNCRAAS